MMFAHHMPTRLLVGQDVLDRLADEVARCSRRCLLVTGRRALRLGGVLERIQCKLQAAHIESVIFDQIEPNPTVETIREGADFARSQRARWVLGLGGGSAMDAAKAIALSAVNQDDLRHFSGGVQPAEAPLPVVAIPTTAGTGSEVTAVAAITDVAAGDKLVISLPQLFPRLALLDPSLTLTLPENVTIDSGLDALCHAIEALFSRQRSVFSDLYARSALDRIIANLPQARSQPDVLQARSAMQLAAMFAGMAAADTDSLAPHLLGHPITVRYDLPHGRATALLMPAFLERMQQHFPERTGFLGRLLGQEADPPAALRAFIEQLGVAPRLGAYGVSEDDLEQFVGQLADRAALERTPGDWGTTALKQLYRQSL